MERSEEINEAVNTANDALYHLSKADEILGHAGNWGLVDMFGGGMLSTFIKRSKMSDAQSEITQAKTAINRLEDNLRDIRNTGNIELKMNDFLGFADYFFDGILADWLVQSRINDARSQIRNAMIEVQGILDGLEDIS
jgi:hypothetical protein